MATVRKAAATRSKRGRKVHSPSGKAIITASFNNTIITITDLEGSKICSSSCGVVGFKGTRKSTAYAAARAAEDAAAKALQRGVKEVAVYVKGPGTGRNAAVKSLKGAGLKVRSLSDITPLPHNGCRPKKRRKI